MRCASHAWPWLMAVTSTTLLLIACGIALASPRSTAVPTGSKQIIEYYGDSTIWGYKSDVGGQVSKPPPQVFAESLPGSVRYDVRNEGVSGTTACDLLRGTNGRHPAWAQQMASSKATYVLINFAINDQWKHDLVTYKSCLQSLARIAKRSGKKMIFETPNPTRDSGKDSLDIYVEAMKEVARQENVPLIDQYAFLTRYLNGRSPYTICPDGLHPSEEVYVMKGQYAARMFAEIFLMK